MSHVRSLPPGCRRPNRTPKSDDYGDVVDSVKVSVVLYLPVCSGSLAPTDCLSPIDTASLRRDPFAASAVV